MPGKCHFYNICRMTALAVCLSAMAGAGIAQAGMVKMAESEMAEITAAGFSSFTLENNTARMWLNVTAETWSEADQVLANGQDSGWDQNWHGTHMGSDGQYMQMQDFVLEAQFDDIQSGARSLQTLRMGFEKVTGTMTADDIKSFSGMLGGQRRHRDNLGQAEIEFDGDPFMMVLDTGSEYEQPGVYMDFGNARVR